VAAGPNIMAFAIQD